MENRTPLYEEHVKLNASMVDFHGWAMPMQYGKILDEHMAVRNSAGIFDVSHMGDVIISGSDAERFLLHVLPTDITVLHDGDAAYTAFLNNDGNIIDDTIVYRINHEKFFIVPNAATTSIVYNWLINNSHDFKVEISDVSSKIACIALQGKKSLEILDRMGRKYPSEFKFYELVSDEYSENYLTGNRGVIVSGTGYTGEKGVEFLIPSDNAVMLWRKLLSEVSAMGGSPCGLGSRDTLRLEKGMLLSGTDFSSDRNPNECSISFIITNRNQYIGKESLESVKKKEIFRGIKMEGKIIARSGSQVYHGNTLIGRVTSGTLSPVLGTAIALAFIDRNYSKPGTEVEVMVRDRRLKGVISRPRMVP
ncbi:MAG: glycine cleavage system aminomethyltransferase GcvT [Candidatus Thermoplasmatota archaeon]|nr:glycine cleavage system aminomethyltransferase GcvT [Candidatus Thermoplasmatota archaeon]